MTQMTAFGLQVLGGPSDSERAALDALRPAWVRARVFWTPAMQGFGWSDAVVADAEARGAKLLLEWWTWKTTRGPGGDWSDVPVAQHAAWAGELAARYRGRVAAWQIDNEPDLKRGPSAITYAARYTAVRAAIRKADPDATVVMAGLAMSPTNTLYLEAFLRRVQPDVVAVHAYPVLWSVPLKIQMVQRRAKKLPVWVTEGGGSKASEVRAFMEGCRGCQVPLAFVYAASDEHASPWGLYGADGKPKPGAGVFAEVSQ